VFYKNNIYLIMKATQIVLASRPKGLPTPDVFRFEEKELPNLKEGEVLLQPLYISVDPYMRGRMDDAESYSAPFQLEAPIQGRVVARVTESKSDQMKAGDLVLGTLPWATKCIQAASSLRKIDANVVPPSYYLGILGMPGLTAYFGLMDIGKPKAGETVVISGAAGAVGIVAGQIAKIKGCYVVGLAGTDDKVNLLKQEFGFDEVINYKTAGRNLFDAIHAACPNKIDVYFDNVGAEITELVMMNINFKARIVICGQIALYNSQLSRGIRFLPMILTRSALIKGFIVGEYSDQFSEATNQLTTWVKEGKLHFKETFVKGFEKLPEAFLGLFSGQNTGKMLVEV
jgi:NADPH-dependent curcumin reductase CurA